MLHNKQTYLSDNGMNHKVPLTRVEDRRGGRSEDFVYCRQLNIKYKGRETK